MGKARDAGQGILITLVGILLLVTVGFVIGLVVGVVSEEPELVVGHVAGRSTEVDWSLPVEETPVRPVSEEDSWPAVAQAKGRRWQSLTVSWWDGFSTKPTGRTGTPAPRAATPWGGTVRISMFLPCRSSLLVLRRWCRRASVCRWT